jgi:hypothetical protein
MDDEKKNDNEGTSFKFDQNWCSDQVLIIHLLRTSMIVALAAHLLVLPATGST